MKINRKTIAWVFCVSLLWSGCTSTFDDLNTNPDASNSVTPAMLATTLILNYTESGFSDDGLFLNKRIFWGEQIENIQYNRIGNGSFGTIQELTNGLKMIEASSEADLDAYTGLYYYMKGWAFYSATRDMGDIPYSQALSIEENRYPKYDDQKDVFIGVLKDLELAEAHFAKATTNFEGDPFYKGDPTLWRKATNVLRLKVLISLQKRAEDTPELNVQATFSKIVSEGNIFQGNQDNLEINYSQKDGQANQLHESETKSVNVYAASETMIDPLKEYKDYRLFYYFAPMQASVDPTYLIGELLERNDWNAYDGVDVAAPFSEGSAKIASRQHCRPNDLYRLNYEAVPSIRLGYSDMNFILAEAAERGWISGDSKMYYETGVRASFEFVQENTPNNVMYNQGMMITSDYIDSYLQGTEVAFATGGSSTDRLQQIWMQSYLSSYGHLGQDSFFEYRRNGYPEFPINPETNLNDDKTKIPVRWLYPTSESNYNKDQLTIALDRQWGGVEDVNKVMWVLK